MVKAPFNAVIVKPQEEDETKYGSIVIPDLGKESGLKGTIVSVGPGSYSIMGQFIPTTLKEGQVVILPQIGATKINDEGQEYWVCSETQVLAILN